MYKFLLYLAVGLIGFVAIPVFSRQLKYSDWLKKNYIWFVLFILFSFIINVYPGQALLKYSGLPLAIITIIFAILAVQSLRNQNKNNPAKVKFWRYFFIIWFVLMLFVALILILARSGH